MQRNKPDLDNWRAKEVVSVRVARAVQGDMSQGKIYQEIRAGRLEAIHDGGKTMITVASILERLASLPRLDLSRKAA